MKIQNLTLIFWVIPIRNLYIVSEDYHLIPILPEFCWNIYDICAKFTVSHNLRYKIKLKRLTFFWGFKEIGGRHLNNNN